MLRVIVQLVPGGFEPLQRTIASMRIWNASDLADRSDYGIHATEGANPLTGAPPRNVRAEIRDHNRRQSVWTLIAKAAQAAAEPDTGQS